MNFTRTVPEASEMELTVCPSDAGDLHATGSRHEQARGNLEAGRRSSQRRLLMILPPTTNAATDRDHRHDRDPDHGGTDRTHWRRVPPDPPA